MSSEEIAVRRCRHASEPSRGCPVNPRVATTFGQRRLCRRSVGGSPACLLGGSGGLFCGRWFDLVEGDGVAERFELALRGGGRGARRSSACVPVGAELAVGDLVADDVVVGDQEVVADRADRFGFAAAAAELRVVRGEVGVLGADGGVGASVSWSVQPASAGAGLARARGGRRLVVPGQTRPRTRSARRSGTRSCRAPHSAIRTWAARALTPGIVQSSSIRSACGWARSRSAPQVLQRMVERVDVGEQLRDEDAVMRDLEAVCERLAQLRDLRAHPGLGELGEHGRVGDARPGAPRASRARTSSRSSRRRS